MEREIAINMDVLFLVFPFLELPDLALCQRVCKKWKEILKTPHFWRTISDKSQKIIKRHKQFQLWTIEKIKKYKPENIIIYDSENLWETFNILEIFAENNENLRKIKLYFDIEEAPSDQLIQSIAKNCPNLKSFKTHGKFLSDINMIHFKQLLNLKEFGIYNDDSNFLGTHLKTLSSLKKLFLRPHNIEYDCLLPVIINSRDSLKKIFFDCEILEDKQLLSILDKLNPEKIENLSMNFCEKFQENILNSIAHFNKLKKFRFSKGNSISPEGFYNFFKNINCKNLLLLNLSECSQIDDDSVILLAKNGHNIMKLNLSWCIEISSLAINEVFRNCLMLKKIYLTGIKKLNREAFPIINELVDVFDKQSFSIDRKNKKINFHNVEKYFKNVQNDIREKINYYRFLKYLNVRSCDFVPDEILFILKLLFPFQKLINYYGEDIDYN